MPCITIQFDPALGPIINFGIAQPATLKTALDGDQRLSLKSYQALMDTGADVTCISPQIAEEVGLRVIGKRRMVSATGAREVNTYLADIALPFGDPSTGAMSMITDSMTVMEFQPNNPNYQALFGRDVICLGLFCMTGYDNRFTICI